MCDSYVKCAVEQKKNHTIVMQSSNSRLVPNAREKEKRCDRVSKNILTPQGSNPRPSACWV